MSRSLRSLSRPLVAFRPVPLPSVVLTRNFPRAHLNTYAMAHTSAPNGQLSTWHGAGAAEFDLRSMTIPRIHCYSMYSFAKW